mmetsp:Transcript_18969/g.26705  ORF Transcript_18969/g.26705 Transcript_18969/m.26705 type:complete len:84 (-) Transcript_18969:380-631(-)
MATSQAAKCLFRSLLREAKKMNDYNFRLYSIRRIKMGFLSNLSLEGQEAKAALEDGHHQLEILKRQAIIGNLYPSEHNVMESS